MDKRERLEKIFAGERADRIPVAAWRHWPGDDQRAADLAYAIHSFQQLYDWDFAVAAPSATFMVTGYGLQDQWQGAISGKRDIIKRPIQRSLDWTELRPLDPERGDTGRQIQCLQRLHEEFQDETPYVQVIYSPLSQAAQLSGQTMLLKNMRTHGDRLQTGLNTLTESTLRFINSLRRTTAIAGIFYIVEQASYTLLSEEEYQVFGLPYDQKIIDAVGNWWFNTIQISGEAPMIHLFTGMNVQSLNWSDQETHPTLDKVYGQFNGALLGGIGEIQHLAVGTPNHIRDAARHMINQVDHTRFILGHGSSLSIATPVSNLRAMRDIVETRTN